MAIQPFDFYVLRRHLLPIDGLFRLNENCESAEKTEEFLRQLFSKPTLQETLYMASPALYQRFRCWLDGENITEKNKLIQTLFKYYLRASSRCTPYGMFAGCGMGTFFDETAIIFDESKPFQKRHRLDMNYLVEIVGFLLSDKNIQNQLRFYSNNTTYQIADKLHYLFYSIQDHKRSYSICSIDFSEYIEIILEKAKNGCFIKDLVEIIAKDDISEEEANDFIRQLIAEQLLFSEIEPTITGDDFFKKLLQKLSDIQINPIILEYFQKINDLLQKPDLNTSQYEEIVVVLKNLIGNTHKDFLQTDLFFNTTKNTIDKKIIAELSRKFEKLLVLNQGNYSQLLENFKKRFYQRYEEAEVPLAIALDNEIGVGYADFASNKAGISPLIEDISLKNTAIKEVFWVYWKKFTLKKYTEAIQNQDFEIRLTQKDLDDLAKNHTEYLSPLPSNFYVFGSLFHDSEHDFSFLLKNLSGPSALTMLGRFGNGDEKLIEKLEACVNYEEAKNEGVIYAEIVHLPEARVGNISTRPTLRKFEIPYQTLSSVAPENQILIDDLMVSVKGGNKIILRSKKHNKQVIPRLSTAHNFENGLNIYRFLADLQSADECVNVLWHWNLFAQQPFLPRVRYQNIILSPAIWNIDTNEIDFSKNEINHEKLLKIKEKYKIPRFVTISEADNELWIDFENEMCLDVLKDFFLKNSLISMKEVLFSIENCFLKTSQGCFNNEIVIPFRNIDYQPQKIELNKPKIGLQRDFAIGSEWLYFKIYCGEKTADELLKTPLKSLVEELSADEIIESFFFIRYQDPEPHIRLRFKGNPKNFFYAHVINRFNEVIEPFLKSGLVNKILTDTYKREIERYGEKTMLLSEQLFEKDSLSVIEFLSQNPDDEQRFAFALKRMDTYLENFSFDFLAKKHFAEMMQKSFLEEFGEETNRKKLNDKYRNLSKNLMEGFSDEDYFIIKPISEKIIAILNSNQNRLFDLVSSYIHLFINRLFMSNSRTYELALYHFLTKIYLSQKHLNSVLQIEKIDNREE